MLSAEHLAELIEEHRPATSTIVIDACEAGGHSSSAAAMARDKLWRDLEAQNDTAEGHFFIVACGTRETAGEDASGGEFTSVLLDCTEKLGQENPELEWLPAELVASAVIKQAAERGISQTPEWTGLAVSVAVPFCRNYDYDDEAPLSHRSISTRSLPDKARKQSLGAIRLHWNAVNLVGTGTPWLGAAREAIARASEVLDPGEAVSFFGQAATSIWERVSFVDTANDRAQFARYGQFVLVEAGRKRILDSLAADALLQCLSDLAPKVADDIDNWLSNHGWFSQGDGPAGVATTTIRFWDALGGAAFLSVVSKSLASAAAEPLRDAVLRAVEQNPRLHRFVWMGSYSDISLALALAATKTPEVAKAASTGMFARSLRDYSEGRAPIPSHLRGRDLGRALAQRQLDPGTAPKWSDEGFGCCLRIMQLAGVSDIDRNAESSKLTTVSLPSLAYYRPTSEAAQFRQVMRVREPVSFPATSPGVSQLLAAIDGDTSPVTEQGDKGLRQVVHAAAAAGVYRNRSGVGASSALLTLWGP